MPSFRELPGNFPSRRLLPYTFGNLPCFWDRSALVLSLIMGTVINIFLLFPLILNIFVITFTLFALVGKVTVIKLLRYVTSYFFK
jgi:hypothetical protein